MSTQTSPVTPAPAAPDAAHLAPSETSGATRPWLRRAGMAAALLVLLAVFMAYLSPHLAMDLANRLWACF